MAPTGVKRVHVARRHYRTVLYRSARERGEVAYSISYVEDRRLLESDTHRPSESRPWRRAVVDIAGGLRSANLRDALLSRARLRPRRGVNEMLTSLAPR